MGAPRHVLEGVSASDMDSLAHAYVVVPVRPKRITIFLLPDFFPVVLCVFRFRAMARLPLAT